MRAKPKLASTVVQLAGAGARRAGQVIAPYANMTTIGLGTVVAGIGMIFGIGIALIAAGVGCLLAEFNAGR